MNATPTPERPAGDSASSTGRSPVKISEVARAAGVSPGTVSNAINQPDRVNSRTLKRVKQAIAELGYMPNRAARQLRVGHSATIGLIVPDLSYPFFVDLARGAEQEADRRGATIVLANSDQDPARERKLLRIFAQQRMQGVLLAPMGALPDEAFALAEQGTTLVLVDNEGGARESFSSVVSDSALGGRIAARHLIERGCRRLAFVGTDDNPEQIVNRFRGAQAEVAAWPGVSIVLVEPDGQGLTAGADVGADLSATDASERPDGVIASNDAIAVGLVNALVRHGGAELLSHIKVVGYDDLEIAATAVTPVTSIRQPTEEIGRTGVELIAGGLGREPGSIRHVMFTPTLVVRQTT
jgi:LacI family transcriptional regulator